MALRTPLPPPLRKGLTTFSGSLFINNKTSDCGVTQIYNPGQEVLSSLPLQMMLYFNVFYFPFWCLSEGFMLELKYHLLPTHYQVLLVGAYLTIVLTEGLRLYLGYIGNLQEKVPELAGFLLISFMIELPILLFLLSDEDTIRLPLEIATHLILFLFLTCEITAAFFALKGMTKQLAMRFYLKQFEEGPERPGKPPASMSGCQWGEVSWGSLLPIYPELAHDQ
ncbi:transmembrane protein 17B-like [Eublepharis macularius]|uniref:Transmembrane protein 17B-like n=1 Tax=Eublepharis macularius TaxID=481883 RepID=A0AA97K6J0_EUBMA|nr:transmembrane protein 17B-like [Eublepharis macularius]